MKKEICIISLLLARVEHTMTTTLYRATFCWEATHRADPAHTCAFTDEILLLDNKIPFTLEEITDNLGINQITIDTSTFFG